MSVIVIKERIYKLRSEPCERIDLRALQVWKIHGVFKAMVLGIAGLAPAVFLLKKLNWPEWVPTLPVAVAVLYGALEVALLSRLRWERWRYEVSREEIYLQMGIWFIKRTLIPMVRVQHVDTRQGILMRRYGLTAVTISTAAGTHEIPALSEDVADGLRDRIARLARVSDDVI